MSKKFGKFMFAITGKMESNCELSAIRQGMIMAMPLLIISSIALMLMSLPIPAYQDFLSSLWNGKVVEILDFAYSGVMSFFSVILATSISISYAILYNRREGNRLPNSTVVILPLVTLASFVGYMGIQHESFSLDNLSNLHTFSALFTALISGKLYFVVKGKLKIKSKKINDECIYTDGVKAVIPAIFVIIFFACLGQIVRNVLKVNCVQDFLEILITDFLDVINRDLGEGLFLILVSHLMWFFGIHGNNVLELLMQKNYLALDAGIYSKTFQDVFVIMGGCGAIWCLIIAILLFGKKKDTRNIAGLALPNAVFNISEIIIFGLPVILNPIFFLPFILVPIVNCIISYIAIYLDLVPDIVNSVEWTTPILLSGYKATGSWAGVILQLVCISIGVCIYLPFIRMYEKQSEKQFIRNVRRLEEELKHIEEIRSAEILIERDDELGTVARKLAMDLEDAMKKNELFMMYQPQVNCEDICVGAEAVIRWKHPIAGFIYAPLLVQLAREKNKIDKLDELVLNEVARAIARINNKKAMNLKLSVNVTNASLEWEGFEECLEECMEKNNILPENMWIEITEQEALSSSSYVIDKLKRLNNKGHKFLIDDFGMGHTSLLYLQTNCFSVVKLDGMLTRDVLSNKRNHDIIASITYLGELLHFKTTAEFVETEEQKAELKALGCDTFQGYLYSVPVTLDEFIVWMENREKENENNREF